MENNKNTLAKIPTKVNYDGYLWWSNAQEPMVFQNESLPDWPSETDNPFIIEGNLVDLGSSVSYFIRFIDDEYIVNSFDLKELMDIEFIRKTYLPNRFPSNIKKLCFKEFWKSVPDEFCNDMPVLKPAEVVFTGFNCKEE
jgi:CRISPR type III-associated protein (TIGR04423 family)